MFQCHFDYAELQGIKLCYLNAFVYLDINDCYKH